MYLPMNNTVMETTHIGESAGDVVLQCVAACCSMLQCVAVRILQSVAECCRVWCNTARETTHIGESAGHGALQCVAAVAMCCSMLQ